MQNQRAGKSGGQRTSEQHTQRQCRGQPNTTTVSCPRRVPHSRGKAEGNVAVSRPSAAWKGTEQDCPLHCAAGAHEVLFPHEVKRKVEGQLGHQYCDESYRHRCHAHTHIHVQAAQGCCRPAGEKVVQKRNQVEPSADSCIPEHLHPQLGAGLHALECSRVMGRRTLGIVLLSFFFFSDFQTGF